MKPVARLTSKTGFPRRSLKRLEKDRAGEHSICCLFLFEEAVIQACARRTCNGSPSVTDERLNKEEKMNKKFDEVAKLSVNVRKFRQILSTCEEKGKEIEISSVGREGTGRDGNGR